MRSACTWMLEKGTQALSPSPDLIPAKHLTGNSHFDWYNKRGHFRVTFSAACQAVRFSRLGQHQEGNACGASYRCVLTGKR
jgi:hypothetical protein